MKNGKALVPSCCSTLEGDWPETDCIEEAIPTVLTFKPHQESHVSNLELLTVAQERLRPSELTEMARLIGTEMIDTIEVSPK